MLMRAAARGRQCLKGHWNRAILVQFIRIAAGGVLVLLEWLILRAAGLHVQDVWFTGWTAEPSGWPYLLLTMGFVILDLLFVSPLRIGCALYYDRLAQGQETPSSRTCIYQTVRFPVQFDPSPADTHEFVPVFSSSKKEVPVRLVWAFFKKRYWHTVGWRAAVWSLRCLYGVICYAPAAFLWGYSEMLRLAGDTLPSSEAVRLFCEIFGWFALAAGWGIQQLLMLRYMPAQYLVARGMPPRTAIRESKRRMKGRLGEMAWLYLGFSGWLISCVLGIPYWYAAPLFEATRAAAVRRLPAPADTAVQKRKEKPPARGKLRRRPS